MGPGQATALPETPHAHVSVQFPIEETVSSADARVERLEAQRSGAPAVRVVREDRSGSMGFDLRVSRAFLPTLLSVFKARGLSLSPLSILEAARIEAGIPRWGFELDQTVLPDEAGFAARGAISYTKGCYIGQETVARIKTYGHVNRNLARIAVEGAAPPSGSEILFEGEMTGSVTSSAETGEGRSIALGYVKRERAAPGTKLTVRTPSGEVPAEIAPPPLG
jgi:folate-binding protein YgfZ